MEEVSVVRYHRSPAELADLVALTVSLLLVVALLLTFIAAVAFGFIWDTIVVPLPHGA